MIRIRSRNPDDALYCSTKLKVLLIEYGFFRHLIVTVDKITLEGLGPDGLDSC